ncbi:uncharacterized protein LOC122536630 [Frieseomelitta varia]|uniref:uncharacterized protein LOC122536630 n=1 Tax=Frieseomelitta varia TaxID=561572 RepID=UPI001CB682AB|nr:uncharacterized protein LOC122536630 [Frieseomelitta varia]
MTKIVAIALLALGLLALANSQGTLLEMSQQLWTKLLSGGFSKAGKLDPLKVPVIKVDQSEGNTSYRVILRNVEITGLNESTLDSIHIARGRLKSNLSELEAGYVSYSDLRDLDSIRYRFHTLIKEPKEQNESFEAIVSAAGNQGNKFVASAREQESRFERLRQYDPFLMKIQAEKMKEPAVDRAQSNRKSNREPDFPTYNMENAKVLSKSDTTRIIENLRYPADVQLMYAMGAMNTGLNSRNYEQQESYDRSRSGSYNSRSREREEQSYRGDENFGSRRTEERYRDVETSASENVESRVTGQRFVPGQISREQAYGGESRRLEKQPGYIDIVYADGNRNGGVRRFGNDRIESRKDARVFGVKDTSKDILESRRVISGNCTDGESLSKRNDAVKAAIQAKRLDGLSRYAKNYQENQGYFEEGMQLVYHYGGMNGTKPEGGKFPQGARQKRAHRGNDTDDDVMHVIMKIRIPLLRVKSDYYLMGKVGQELVRGNGKLNGNFTDVVSDFTIELKKSSGQNGLIVRAARSKLNSRKQNVSFEGMNEQGPLKSILSHGLMAAEAVAAMLADDLATKALNDKTADAMIYRMYKNLPVN